MLQMRAVVFGMLCLVTILFITGCKKPEPARLLVEVDGELFSDAVLLLDGIRAGKLIKTLIKGDGQLFIDDIYTVTLPPGHRDIPVEDQYTGTLDSLELKSGTHLILLQTEDGNSLQINASLKPGINIITYNSDEQLIKWNNTTIRAASDSTVTLP